MVTRKKIQELCSTIVSGGTPSTQHKEWYDGDIPWLNTKEVKFNKIESTERSITSEGLANCSAKWVPANTVVVAMYGATAGNVAITGIPLTTNQACCNLIINPDVADYRYVYYALMKANKQLKSLANGGAQQNLSVKQIKDFAIPVPCIDEQREIAEILYKLDEKINLNSKINDNLEQQILSLYEHLFVTQKESDWKEGTLSDIGTIVGGGTPSKSRTEYYAENGIAWITPKDLSINKSKYIYHGEVDISDLGFKKSSASFVPAGTVLFSSRAPIGYIAIAGQELTTNQGFKSVIPSKAIWTSFIYCFLKKNLPLIESMSSGSTFKEISGSSMKQVPVTIPDNKSLDLFNQYVNPFFDKQKMLEKENRTLVEIRDTLLLKLL